MAVVNLLSAGITNKEANINTPPEQSAIESKRIIAVVASNADDTAASTYRFMRVPSNARVSSLKQSNAVAGVAGAIDVGIYDTNEDGIGAVVDADFFASALVLTGSAKTREEVAFESGIYTLANSEKQLWEALGLAEDPNKHYDVVATITTTFNGGPTSIRMELDYEV